MRFWVDEDSPRDQVQYGVRRTWADGAVVFDTAERWLAERLVNEHNEDVANSEDGDDKLRPATVDVVRRTITLGEWETVA